ncbi:putative radical SAM enzyme (TIGR03279 family) [Mobilisporobacter senegalensis]|uniref:Putative radical SAM enzyme (TIGR03279 family) n=1 Tax=Mobilisporobacter senegalensis TaxID=1329262 RepID=A0A3N1XRV1_9FIRM|nr:DUF512 domain-containing protein [Mobilisporobacter senegalensis]ROR29389.1 putative radical SAM enzyme (TIGR03279 family) [Mobilisporobacter senegalensis]
MIEKRHIIKCVEEGSIAEELGITSGDILISINDTRPKDIFDYEFLIHDCEITVIIRKPDGEEWELEIEKDFSEDLGIEFEEGLMDSYNSCRNKCMFCFIDQMPKGMRETLYFKDDDARLSYLQGNYITLTNLKDEDIDRIILYKLAPINISVHTTNKELRARMLKNRFAGDALEKIQKLYENGIEMNSQIVCCKGYNDGKELERTIKDLFDYMPYMLSLSIVPVGLTKFREGLAPLEKFEKDDAREVLDIIHKYQAQFLEQSGTRFVHASDEWYLIAELPIPDAEVYEGYGQIENGVGMIRSLIDEFEEYYDTLKGNDRKKTVSIATGKLAAPTIKDLTSKLVQKFPNVKVHVYTIINDFFGPDITVAGLLTGQDIMKQLKGKELGEYLILPSALLRSGEEVLLDDYTLTDLEKTLGTKIRIVQSDGKSLIDTII